MTTKIDFDNIMFYFQAYRKATLHKWDELQHSMLGALHCHGYDVKDIDGRTILVKMMEKQKMAETDTQKKIEEVCDSIKSMLLEKNRKYGNSALEPVRVFSKADTVEQLKVRMDDKLSRIRSGQIDEDEDVLRDLAGYIVLLIIAKIKE